MEHAAAVRRPEAADGLDRIWTVPNLLSVGRLALLCGFLVLLFGERERVAAAALLAVAGITDFLDGYFARRLNQVTTIGKVLDPTVDRIVLGTSVIAMVVYGAAPVWLVALVLGREALVSIAVLVLAALGARRINVLFIGKAGTLGFMVCFPLLLAGHGPGTLAEAVRDLAWVLLVPSLVCSLAAAAAYVPLARRALAEGRGASPPPPVPDPRR